MSDDLPEDLKELLERLQKNERGRESLRDLLRQTLDEATAASPTVPEADRAVAKEKLAELTALTAREEEAERVAAIYRARVPGAIANMAEIANDTSVDPDLRRHAQMALRSIAERMREQGTDISHWIAHPDGKPN